jgi:hypothetical protein
MYCIVVDSRSISIELTGNCHREGTVVDSSVQMACAHKRLDRIGLLMQKLSRLQAERCTPCVLMEETRFLECMPFDGHSSFEAAISEKDTFCVWNCLLLSET